MGNRIGCLRRRKQVGEKYYKSKRVTHTIHGNGIKCLRGQLLYIFLSGIGTGVGFSKLIFMVLTRCIYSFLAPHLNGRITPTSQWVLKNTSESIRNELQICYNFTYIVHKTILLMTRKIIKRQNRTAILRYVSPPSIAYPYLYRSFVHPRFWLTAPIDIFWKTVEKILFDSSPRSMLKN